MRSFSLLVVFVLFQAQLFAETYLYFENSTSLNFSVSSVQTGSHTMDSDEWWHSTADVAAWQNETNLLDVNRNEGIHNGTNFYLTTTLSNAAFSIDLKLKLNGNFIGSDIWSSASGPGFNHGWTSDNNFHSSIFTVNGRQYELKYTFYFTGGYDDILFTLHEFDVFKTDAAELADPYILNVLAYNTYMLTPPIALSDQGTRAQHIDDAVHDFDAILIQEVFDNSARATLLEQLAPEYPYQTAVVDLPNLLEDGGIMIVSRWPIEYSRQMTWNDCNTPDCLANKGVMYARINKLGKKYHLFSTHQQAFNGNDDIAVRNLQMQQFSAFIDAQNIPLDEAVIFGGDMNVDKHTNKLNEYNNMLSIFNASEPTYIGHVNSWDKYANHYIGLGSEEPEYLDYVLADDDYLIPYEQSNTVWVLRSNHNDMWNIHDLSDHFGIHGRFVYCIRETTTVDAGWSFISSSIIPDDPDMLSVLQGFENDIIILKNGAGDVVIPSIGFNGVGDWDVTAGYQVKSSNSVELDMECTPVDPSKTPILLTEGWSMIAYLRNSPMDASIAMAGVISDVIIMKNETGQIFLPAFGINNIGDMNPGEGYKIKMLNTNTLTYAANTLRNPGSIKLIPSVAAHYTRSYQTVENATVVIPNGSIKGLQEGDEIGVFNSAGQIAGSGVFEGNHLALTVWGVDELDPVSSSMVNGEQMKLKLWRPSLQREYEMTVTYSSGTPEYRNDGLSIVGHGSVPDLENEATPPYTSAAFYLYPNPASNSIHLEVVLPKASEIEISLFDLMGRTIAPPELYELKEGTSVLNKDVSHLPSGRYFYRVRSKDALMNGRFIKMP